jgi:hypothetical protein
LIEALVVISILGILMAIVLPAVQAARESSRRTQCANHLKQLALGCLAHENAHHHLPTGGWGWRWQPDPDRGFGRRQPGGWPYALLPFVEQATSRQIGQAKSPAEKRALGRMVAETPVPLFHCPSRRSAVPYPFVHPLDFYNIDRPAFIARSDYSANAGDQTPYLYGAGPASLAEGDGPTYKWTQTDGTGVVFRRSEVRVASIRDGLSSTYLLGESYLNPQQYETGKAENDDQGLYVGFDRDTLRVTSPEFPPLRDHHGLDSDHSFGSAHPAGWHAALCDGSVRMLSYQIGVEVHRRLGNRKDCLPLDAGSF